MQGPDSNDSGAVVQAVGRRSFASGNQWTRPSWVNVFNQYLYYDFWLVKLFEL
jgi:hypothetical protein